MSSVTLFTMASLLPRPSSCVGCNTLIHIVATAISFLLFLMFWGQQKRLCPSCPSSRKSSLQPGKVVRYLLWCLQEGGNFIKKGQKAKNWRAGRMEEHRSWAEWCKACLAIKKNLYRQPPGNTSPASLDSQTKRDRATTGL